MTFLWKSSNADEIAEQGRMVDALNKYHPMVTLAPDGSILDANDLFLAAIGYDLGAVKAKSLDRILSPEQRSEETFKNFWKDMLSGSPVSNELAFVGESGEVIWMQVLCNPVHDARGALTKIIQFAFDITKSKMQTADAVSQIYAIRDTSAVIEFSLDGTILHANKNFLKATEYELDEIRGQHHRMFLTQEDAMSHSYKTFWTGLAAGQVVSGEQKRVTKSGREIWLQADYIPIRDLNNKIIKVVKYATDITAQKTFMLDATGQLDAIGRSQAVIEFEMNGTILTANENFLATMGYSLSEIQGQHHSMFLAPEDNGTEEYRNFWRELRSGQFHTSEFRRIGKNGKVVWIQASYNPVLDYKGEPYKVVKFASDITEQKFAVNALETGLTALLTGDLTVTIPDSVSGDFAGLRDRINGSMAQMSDLVRGMLEVADAIANDSEAIASNTNDLSTRGEHLASTIEQTTAAMGEISGTVKRNAASAAEANDSAKNASQNADKGGSIVGEAVAAMERIEGSSGEISKIVEVIDSIAFRTNLLALNAGVEAARAGDAGKGFSVVASEVRSLAQRASDAAKDINQLIESSSKEVAEGSRLVNESGRALSEIVSSVATVVESIKKISAASDEQTQSIVEVTQAISQIDATSQKTAIMYGDSAASAAKLAVRAIDLQKLASFFTCGDGGKTKAPGGPSARNQKPAPASRPKTVTQMKTVQSTAPKVQFEEAADDDDWQEF